ncbi:MAG: hypothetical protein B7Z33_12150 [Sphingomonadales bacterium 12-68-11]|nr:MAG: hypothetical protein B7Z33_12150 [Sphingomonadales bacterium 12-68-11]
MWGDDRTSADFISAPPWFFAFRQVVQILSILILFVPPRPRDNPSFFGLFFAVATLVALYFTNPILEAENILISSSIQIAIIAAFLSIFKPSVELVASDFALLFFLFLGGFAIQIFLYFQFDVIPSHTIKDVFIRFNGITNDSLTTAFVLSVLIPWAATGRRRALKAPALIGMAFATGSMFAVAFVPVTTIAYLLYKKSNKAAFISISCLLSAGLYFYDLLAGLFAVKLDSIITHLSFFLDLSGGSLYKSVSCSEEFCESFVEAGFHLSRVYVVAFYAMLAFFILPLWQARQAGLRPAMSADAIRLYGVALLTGSLVHPVPLIPLAVPLFLVLASLHSNGPGGFYAPATPIRGYTRPVAS